MTGNKRDYSFELIDVINFLLRWRKPLLYISAASAVISVIVSSPWIIRPMFKSTAIFYPSTNNSISSALFTDFRVKTKDPLEFGEQIAAQQYVQLLESDLLKSRVIKSFNLEQHYGIDSDDKVKNYKLGKIYNRNISIKKTPFASIEVNVLDEDPALAANIANGIVSILDSVKSEVQRRVATQALQIIEKEFRNKQNEVAGIQQRMKEIMENGVFDVEEQSKSVIEVGAKGGSPEFLKNQKEALAKYGAEANSLKGKMLLELEQLSELSKKYDQALVDVNAELSNVFIIQQASQAEKKSYPVRWLIIVVSVLSSFILGCVVLLFIDKYNQQKEKLAI